MAAVSKFKILFLILIFTLNINNSFARNQEILDSLKTELKKPIHDTIKANLYHIIARQYLSTKIDSAGFYAKKAISFTGERIPADIEIPVTDSVLNYLIRCKAEAYYTLGETYSYVGSFTEAIPYYYKAIEFHEKAGYQRGIADAYTPLGICQYALGNYPGAIEYFQKSLEIYLELEDMDKVASCYNNIGIIYRNQGLLERAVENYMYSLRVYIEEGNKRGEASANLNLGIVHESLQNYDLALEYSYTAIEIFKEEGVLRDLYRSYNNIGIIYNQLWKIEREKKRKKDEGTEQKGGKVEIDETLEKEYFDKTIYYYQNSLKLAEEIGDKYAMSAALSNIGNIYRDQKNYIEALNYYYESLRLDREIGDTGGKAILYSRLAGLYNDMYQSIASQTDEEAEIIKSDYNHKAIEYGLQSLNLAKEVGSYSTIRSAANNLYEAYANSNSYYEAFKYAVTFIDANSIVYNDETARALTEMQSKYEAEKKELEIENLNKENALRRAELAQSEEQRKRQLAIIYSFIAGFIIIITFSIIIFRLFVQKKKANILLAEQKEEILEKNAMLMEANEEIRAQKEEIESQHDVVVKQKDFIEIQKQRIDSSIRYAQRIQSAVLPSNECIQPLFSDYFVFFRPKDVVSGDFYWTGQLNEWIIVVAADCTGHGVPGAFMSMLGISMLNQISISSSFNNAADILQELRTAIVQALKQSLTEESQHDGMDISLAIISKKTHKCHWAGANNPLWIIRSDTDKQSFNDPEEIVEEIKGDKMPIAIFVRMENYQNHEIQLKKGDKIYLFSDGYVDQFGGMKNKKFNRKTFRRLIGETSSLSMQEQKQEIEKTFDEWINPEPGVRHDQIDDVVVLGIQV